MQQDDNKIRVDSKIVRIDMTQEARKKNYKVIKKVFIIYNNKIKNILII